MQVREKAQRSVSKLPGPGAETDSTAAPRPRGASGAIQGAAGQKMTLQTKGQQDTEV